MNSRRERFAGNHVNRTAECFCKVARRRLKPLTTLRKRRSKLAAGPGIAPRLPAFQTGALTDSAIQRKLVLGRGNAPRSRGYRPRALLLSYTRKSGTSAWIRTKTSSLNRAVDYYYPTLVFESAPGWSRTSVNPFRRRMPQSARPREYFDQLKTLKDAKTEGWRASRDF